MNPFKGRARLGVTPVPQTPYQKAGQAWDQRLGTLRSQIVAWRGAALGLIVVNGGQTAGLLWSAARGDIVPWIVEVDHLGEARVVAPAQRGYRPPDPMIAAILARFVEDVRSIPADEVVFRKNWLHAYAFTDKTGAKRLSAYANQARPFAELGRVQVSVEVTSVVRASPDSFRVAWTETRYADGQLAGVERWSGILTLTVRPPDSLKGLNPNPLGVFVSHLDWSKEFGA